MRIYCPSCSQQVHHKDINIHSGIAKCTGCSFVINLADFGLGKRFREKRRLSMIHERVNVVHDEIGFSIVRNWHDNKLLIGFLGVFAVFWNLITWLFAGPVLMKLMTGEVPKGAFVLITHVPIGLFVGYLFLAMIVNRTRLSINFNLVRLKHGPLPWIGSFEIQKQEIENLYCEQYVMYQQNRRPVWGFKVVLLDKNGKKRDTFKGISDYEIALSIEQEAERALGIRDREIPEEFKEVI